MPFDNLTSSIQAPSPSIVSLSTKVWSEKLITAFRLKHAKAAAEKAAREADGLWKCYQAELIAALGGSTMAKCGSVIVTRKDTARSDASITLTDGVTYKWNEITSVKIGNRTVPASDIAKIYGGREGSVSVDIVGVTL